MYQNGFPGVSKISAVGFDLDDTLHQFVKASTTASEAVFAFLSEKHGCSRKVLRDAYQKILGEGQSRAFVEGKTSAEYRAERFGKLLECVSAPLGEVNLLLTIYRKALGQALCLNEGAREALVEARRLGRKTVVISEGPHDAQQWTLKKLGIARYVDVLVTSGEERVSKTDGLFGRALAKVKCDASSFLYIGDSFERDIVPAQRIGINAVLLASDGRKYRGDTLVISSLNEVVAWLSGQGN